MTWWEPGSAGGYITNPYDSRVQSICPNQDYCNGPKILVNRPMRLIMYVYDKAGTFAAKRTVDITQADLDQMMAFWGARGQGSTMTPAAMLLKLGCWP
jgi:hypothetical protein